MQGHYFHDPNGNYILNLKDIHSFHYDQNNMSGCCGPPDEPENNLLCFCKHEIGREISDCMYPHFIRLTLTGVKLITDRLGVFHNIKRLENLGIYSDLIQNFYDLQQFGSDDEPRRYFEEHLRSL